MKRVGIYLRVSTEEQARIQDGSLVSQRKRLEEYIEGQNRRDSNWGVLVDIYCDEGKSAKDMNRPEFQRLLQDIKLHKINLVITTELSRLSRSIKDFCEVWDIFKSNQASFITLRENFDTTTAAGEMMVFNLINFAQFERKQTAERISANWKSRAKRGLWNGGTIPLGFDRNAKKPGELLINPTEAEQVRMIFDLFLKVGSVRKTCLELTKRGLYSKKFTNKHGDEKGGGHFTIMSVQRILTNKAYIGLRELKQFSDEAVKASWPAIIEGSTFNEVQEKLSLNKNKFKPTEWKKYPFPLTELLLCGECGKHMGGKSGHGRNGKHFYYGHPRQLHSDGKTHLHRCQLENVRAPKLEEIILNSFGKLIDEPGLLDHWLEIYAKRTTSEIPALEGKLKGIENDITTCERRISNLMGRLSDLPPEISADPIYAQLKELNLKINELTAVRDRMLIEKRQLSFDSINRQGLVFKLRRTIQNLEKTPVELRRPIYSNVIKFAELYPTKIRMALYAPTGTGGSCTVSSGAREWT
jgi:site-specific DNA recombinase